MQKLQPLQASENENFQKDPFLPAVGSFLHLLFSQPAGIPPHTMVMF